MIFRSIKQFGNWGHSGGGVSGIELVLWDRIGKVYGVLCYHFLGGKYRDRVRLYADTPEPEEPMPEAYAERVKGRMDLGLTYGTTPNSTSGSPTAARTSNYRKG